MHEADRVQQHCCAGSFWFPTAGCRMHMMLPHNPTIEMLGGQYIVCDVQGAVAAADTYSEPHCPAA